MVLVQGYLLQARSQTSLLVSLDSHCCLGRIMPFDFSRSRGYGDFDPKMTSGKSDSIQFADGSVCSHRCSSGCFLKFNNGWALKGWKVSICKTQI